MKAGIGARGPASAPVMRRTGKEEEEERGTEYVHPRGTKTRAAGRSYFNFTGFPFPLGPFFERTTLRYEVEAGRIWIFEQAQTLGFSSVTVNVRMTVIKLRSGGLWVHAPIAPTQECIRLLNELDAPVEFIMLPTFAYEHKIYAGPFSRRYPKAKIYVAPRQWSWPLNLPPSFFGIFPAGRLKNGDRSVPWADEIEQKILELPGLGIGPFVEVAFFHKPSRTLLLTDGVIKVPEQPPEVVDSDKLLASAANGIAVKLLSKGVEVPDTPVVNDNEENRVKGWQRMVLLILYLGPGNLLDPEASFNNVVGRLIVSPIVKTLVFSKAPEEVKDWIDEITTEWNFRRIIPAHFSAPIAAGPQELRAAFSFLYRSAVVEEEEEDEGGDSPSQTAYSSRRRTRLWPFQPLPLWEEAFSLFGRPRPKPIEFPKEDMRTLSSLDAFLVSVGAVKRSQQS
ncbi:hypothetical protein CBR_g61504 [Chara braunii]|uniref:DUF4336 domain-containing protein n=1 Tax=Chara braunii TaxID=69332 RepID=A0A388K8V4_CHABU|nr:hypothetical protein CBR_g61504 [Chara braunii]|eukprot:GBG66461.1 hypothetical protein CBR_g61504 [Chara braunii]